MMKIEQNLTGRRIPAEPRASLPLKIHLGAWLTYLHGCLLVQRGLNGQGVIDVSLRASLDDLMRWNRGRPAMLDGNLCDETIIPDRKCS